MIKLTKTAKKRLERGNKRVLWHLKQNTGANAFHMEKMFKRTFGKPPVGPVFMQKTKGGLIFFVDSKTFYKIVPIMSPPPSGQMLQRKYVNIRGLKSKVILINNGAIGIPEVKQHEIFHLLHEYQRPGIRNIKKVNWNKLELNLGRDLLSEMGADLYGGLPTDDGMSILLIMLALTGGQEGMEINKRMAQKRYELNQKLEEARNLGIDRKTLANLILHSEWSNIEHRLKKLMEKHKK